MNWERVLKKKKTINHSSFNEAVEEVISTRDEFTSEEILDEVKELYIQKIVENNYLPVGSSTTHANRINKNHVGKAVAKLGTHRIVYKTLYLEGKRVGQKYFWRRIE